MPHARERVRERDGKPVDGTQLLLALCDLHEKPARAPRTLLRERAYAGLEARGAAALTEIGEPVGKRTTSAWLTYLSAGGEVLETELHNLTLGEREYVRRVSLKRSATRQVT